ncbi:MAG TPA: hypothetical protein VJM51_00655 [Dehalococcoidia bacterium]|nr:hypothetical protein [Dehalococcoidia bacterium]
MPAARMVESGSRHEGADLHVTPQAGISIELLPRATSAPTLAQARNAENPAVFAPDLTLLAILNVRVTGDACRPQASQDDHVRNVGSH